MVGINEDEVEITCKTFVSPNLKFKVFSDGNMIIESKAKDDLVVNDVYIDKEDLKIMENAVKESKVKAKEK
jgi:hypothetical protein